MNDPQELNEEELSAIAGGVAPVAGDRVVQASIGTKTKITIAEKDLPQWQQRQAERGIASSDISYKYGTFVSRGNINWD